MAQTKRTASLLSSLVLSVGPTTSIQNQTSNLSNIKLITIFIILYRLAYQNNSNYLSLLIRLYLYFARAYVDAIMLFNCFGLSILYNIFQKSLRNIIESSQVWIKEQATNYKLIGT